MSQNPFLAFLLGPPGNPEQLRAVADNIEAVLIPWSHDLGVQIGSVFADLQGEFSGQAANELQKLWTDGGPSFQDCATNKLPNALASLVEQLRAYAAQLQKAQDEHWIQMALIVGMLVIDAAQGGADPVTDAETVNLFAQVGIAGATGAAVGVGTDAFAQLGAIGVDWLRHGKTDENFDLKEMGLSGLSGLVGGAIGGGAAAKGWDSGWTGLASDLTAGAGGSAVADLVSGSGLNVTDVVAGGMTSSIAGAATRGIKDVHASSEEFAQPINFGDDPLLMQMAGEYGVKVNVAQNITSESVGTHYDDAIQGHLVGWAAGQIAKNTPNQATFTPTDELKGELESLSQPQLQGSIAIPAGDSADQFVAKIVDAEIAAMP